MYENTIDFDDDQSGSQGGYTRHGNFIPADAMVEIVDLRAENERLRDLIKDMSRAIDCLSTGTPLRDLDEILLRVWKVQGEGE